MMQEFVNMTQELIRKHLKKMHTAVPGRVTAYNPVRGMCDIQPVMQYKKPDGKFIDYPELKDVPVWWPQTFGQEATIVYPIKNGDEVIVLLAERPIDYWLFGRQTEQDLMFDLSEALCIPGMFARPNPLAKTAQDEAATIIQRKDTFVKIKEKEIELNSREKVVVNADSEINMTAPMIKVRGQVSVTGGITTTEDVVAESVSLENHTHTDSMGGTTTPPN